MRDRIETVAALRRRLAHAPRPVGFVPTMGALHAGHTALIDRARRESATVIVSIFVNPTQFDNPDDLARYPRTIDADLALCDAHGVDIVFRPAAAEMYRTPPVCTVDVGALAAHLCGPFRPGHFQAVATVVLKLFHIVQPQLAYFGEKDAQQLAIVRRMVEDLDVPVSIVAVPTVREPDGLALSSRNRRLGREERQAAPLLYAALQEAERLIREGERDAGVVQRRAAATMAASPLLRLEYLEVVDPDTMQPIGDIARPVRVAGAVWAGDTRLIDNLLAVPPIRT